MVQPGAGCERACERVCVIRRLTLIELALVLILAAGLVTAIFFWASPQG